MDRLKPISLSPLRVAVLLGGDSAEREISLQSGEAVSRAIAGQGHSVIQVDPADTDLSSFGWSSIDVAFLALHGKFGEDGGVQKILEQHGVSFTGSNSVASRLAFSKVAAKESFVQAGILTPPAVSFSAPLNTERDLTAKVKTFGFPVVVKPDAQGSSIGVTIVQNEADLGEAIGNCVAISEMGLIEKAIDGSEWTLGVIDDNPLPLIQISTDRSFFDFTAKYKDDGTGYHFDADADPTTYSRIETAGLDACRALGTSGIARADIMLDSDGNPWVLEVNTIPGMTDHSLVPKAAERIGLSLGELCDIVLARTLAQAGRRKLRDAS